MDSTGSDGYLQMLAKEDSNLLVGAALPAQLPNYFGVLFELRAWRPFGNFVEQLANALIHRKYLFGRSGLRRQSNRFGCNLNSIQTLIEYNPIITEYQSMPIV